MQNAYNMFLLPASLMKRLNQAQPRGYKTLFLLNSTKHKLFHAHVKMPKIVGILTFISMINKTSESLKQERSLFFSILVFMNAQF